MTDTNDILRHTTHRPWLMPDSRWWFYQEWKRAIFFHWAVPVDIMRKCIPAHFNLDTYEGKAYVSLVAFDMRKLGPRYLPSVPAVSDFYEINLRTYIDNDGKTGVYFLSMEGSKALSVFIAKNLSDLPYENARVSRDRTKYKSVNSSRDVFLNVEYEVREPINNRTALDKWLVERYCLYFDHNGWNYRYDIHHKEWPLNNMKVRQLAHNYKVGSYNLQDIPPDLVHYSDGVEVLAWPKVKV